MVFFSRHKIVHSRNDEKNYRERPPPLKIMIYEKRIRVCQHTACKQAMPIGVKADSNLKKKKKRKYGLIFFTQKK